MKNIIVTIGLVILSQSGLAQSHNTSIGVKLLPGLTSVYGVKSSVIESSRFSPSGGIEVRQRVLKDALYVQTGVFFMDRGYGLNSDVTDENGVFIRKARISEHHYHLTIPVSLVYKYKRFLLGAGPNINFLLGRKWYVDGDLISTDKTGLQTVVAGAQFFTGYELPISEHVSLEFEGYVNPTFNVTLIHYGIGIGVKYVFGKEKSG